MAEEDKKDGGVYVIERIIILNIVFIIIFIIVFVNIVIVFY